MKVSRFIIMFKALKREAMHILHPKAVQKIKLDMDTSVSAVVACINNIGPGLGVVSPVGNYSGFSVLSKIVLSLNMLIGRLEIYPMLLLISPAVWHRRA